MRPPLGLSIGATNFVAVSAGEPPVTRRSSLTLPPQGAPQLGSSAETADGTESGLLVDGFVDCVGDQIPLVAADGSTHQPELLLADAIDAMVDVAGAGGCQLAVAVPAHWPPAAWRALQEALQTHESFSALGAPPRLVSDAVAALTALHADRGVASRGVVALLDFGGGGTKISLADAASGFRPIGETLCYRDFSGDLIDQAILSYIVGSTDQGGDGDAGGTATVGDLTQLTDECRQAKERLSEQTATELIAALPGYRARIALTRAEFDDLIRRPLGNVIVALELLLQRNRISWNDLAAIATAGGGARIPLITERLSAGHQVPMVTSELPALAMAVGAALWVARGGQEAADAEEAPATTMAPIAPVAATAHSDGTDQRDPAPHDWAWSEEELRDEPVPFVGEPYSAPSSSSTRNGSEEGRRRHRVPQLVFGLGALAAMIGVGGVAYTLTSASHDMAPTEPANSPTTQVAPPSPKEPAPARAAAPPSAPPAPASPAAPPAPPETTADPPATTTPPPQTTTTTTTTTRAPTTTTPTTLTTTVSPTTPTSTTTAATAVPMTTEYLTIPLVPMPIPIEVPAH